MLPLLLKGLKPASLATFSRFLGILPEVLSSAFRITHVKRGWEGAGLWAFDKVRIMQGCSTFSSLSGVQGGAVMAAIPALIEIAAKHSQVSDDEMQTAVGPSIDLAAWSKAHGGSAKEGSKPLEDQAINRRRAVWLNHAGVIRQRREKMETDEREASEGEGGAGEGTGG